MRSVSQEEEKARKARLAQERRAKIMAQMSALQKAFIKENAELLASMETGEYVQFCHPSHSSFNLELFPSPTNKVHVMCLYELLSLSIKSSFKVNEQFVDLVLFTVLYICMWMNPQKKRSSEKHLL